MNMSNVMELHRAENLLKKELEYSKWVKEIPFIEVPNGWEIRPIPNFALSVARFNIKAGEYRFSVYLDCYDRLGYFGEPYWEVYKIRDDIARFAMDDTKGLINCIKEELARIDAGEGLD